MSGPLDTRSTTQKLYTYVNGRSVRDRFLTRVLIDSYGRMIDKGKFPQGVLFIDMGKGGVDVNVHPAKNEVRFEDARLVGGLIKEAVMRMLETAPWLGGYSRSFGEASAGHGLSRETAAAYGSPANADNENARGMNGHASYGRGYDEGIRTQAQDMHSVVRGPVAHPGEGEMAREGLFGGSGFYSGLRVLGQLGELYIICASAVGMILVDQHAAHERINYERLKRAYAGDGPVPSQDLLVPEVLELSPHESDVLSRHCAELGRLGLLIEEFGENTFILRSVPALLKNTDLKRLVRDIASEIKESGAEKSLTDKIDTVISTMACHSSIRANYELNPEKMKALLEELDLARFPHSCPHGRPVAREISYTEIERMFKRT
jgi:DNA mismatch repair protein MutL